MVPIMDGAAPRVLKLDGRLGMWLEGGEFEKKS
jgi:hypothetical protein